jgi:hypothetical protein
MRIATCSACLHNASMPNILIRNVPPEVHARLTAAAKESGQSLQQYVLGLISTPSKRMSHAETIAWLRGRHERMLRDGTDSSDSMGGAELVRQARIEHAREIYDAMGVDWDPEDEFR